ncbi:methionine gamma-lyase [Baia soyae]|uniref:L-methionine gamma-lyase n=1 Tax=Baia soyae TaxID=1544746 RepID=A0A4R2RZP3_9BACL|nr:methionine gamma-lyase [Baia soyae]TCP70475.1 methionine-gamma-lyase [Baia soyae]
MSELLTKMMPKEWGFATQAIHGDGTRVADGTGSLVPPIYQTSTFVFENVEQGARRFSGLEEGYAYTRLGNPTVQLLEEKIASLEGADSALAFGSGMAAISAVLLGMVKTGDHVLCSRSLYGCTFGLLKLMEERYQVEVSLIEMSDEETVRRAIRPNTTLIYLETPANPTLELIDLKMVSKVAKEKGICTAVDNTFLSPYLQRPIELGCDIVIHSATKYIGGHGDVVAGVIAGSHDMMQQIQITTQKDLGGILAPMDAFLLLRGLKTLALRMEQHNRSAQLVAEFLESHPLVSRVYYPGLSSFPQHELAKKQMDGFGGVIAFELTGGYEAAVHMLNRLKLCGLAVSLGDVDTLIQHPASMTHSGVPREERWKMGISDGLVRLSVGIEEVEDIMEDLRQAMEK